MKCLKSITKTTMCFIILTLFFNKSLNATLKSSIAIKMEHNGLVADSMKTLGSLLDLYQFADCYYRNHVKYLM